MHCGAGISLQTDGYPHPFHTSGSSGIGPPGFSLLQDEQSEEGCGKPAGPLFAWKLELVAARLGVGLLLSSRNSREFLATA